MYLDIPMYSGKVTCRCDNYKYGKRTIYCIPLNDSELLSINSFFSVWIFHYISILKMLILQHIFFHLIFFMDIPFGVFYGIKYSIFKEINN